jgi:multisubunit Na+/H+ antiporter MnhE subunit
MAEYTAIDFLFGMYHNTDAHNQFLATTISHGLVGLLVLLFICVYPLTQKRFTGQPMFWFFYLPVMLTAMVESIFGVQKGIVFFCLFLMIFDVYRGDTKTSGFSK